MGNGKLIRQLNGFLKNIESTDVDKSDIILQMCRTIFKKEYGIETLKLIGCKRQNDITLGEWEKALHLDENFHFTDFSQVYDHYLSVRHREKTGSYYTPYYIIDYMVERSLEMYLSREIGCYEKLVWEYFHQDKLLNRIQLKEMIKVVDRIKIIDIACGTGLFLMGCFKKLLKYKKKIYKDLGQEIDNFTISKYMVENNLFGIDVQEQPAMITRMVLLSMVYDQDKENCEKKVHLNIRVGDSLTDPIFKEVINEGGFDLVIGNPPYLGEKGNKAIFDRVKSTPFGQKYYEGKMDYFYFFIYKSIEILKPKGILSYITTNYFVTADGAERLRSFMKDHCTFINIFNFNDYEIFKSAKGQHNIIFFLSKGVDSTQEIQLKCIQDKNVEENEILEFPYRKRTNQRIHVCTLKNQESLYSQEGHILLQSNDEYDSIFKKIVEKSECTLGELCNINQGFVSGADKVRRDMIEKKLLLENDEEKNIRINQGIFVLTKNEAHTLGILESPYLKSMYKNSDIQRYFCKSNVSKYILYIADNFLVEPNDKILRHLSRYKKVLEMRRETMRGIRPWYALQWPRNQEIFENTKIVVPHRAKENKFALDQSSWYASADVYFITQKEKKVNWYVLLGFLNSKMMYFWLYNRGKRKGDYLELYANPLKSLPIICSMNKKMSNKVTAFVKDMIQNGENETTQKYVDEVIFELFGLTSKEIQIIEDLYKKNLNK